MNASVTKFPLSGVKGILSGDMLSLNCYSGKSGKKQHFESDSDDVAVVYLLNRESEKQERFWPKSGNSAFFSSFSGVFVWKPAKPSISIGLQDF